MSDRPVTGVPEGMFEGDDAQLRTINIAKLMERDPEAMNELYQAGIESGFFYIDCTDHSNGELLKQAAEVHQIHKDTCDLPQEEKDKYTADHDHTVGEEIVCGYKRAGHQTGPVEGKRDGFEGFVVFDTAFNKCKPATTFKAPPTMTYPPKHAVLKSFNNTMGDIGRTILESLSISLGMPEDRYISSAHRAFQPNTTGLGLLKYFEFTPESEGVGHIAHRDTGSLSMVFSDVPGLQVLMRGDKWEYVMPKPGCFVCNIGDSVYFLSGGKLRSSLHRVVPHPQASRENKLKYTTVYLMRPETEAIFVDYEGKEWKSLEWHNMKMRVLSSEQEEQAKNSVLTGKESYMGYWKPPTDNKAENINVVAAEVQDVMS